MRNMTNYLKLYPEVILSVDRPGLEAVKILDRTSALVLVVDEHGRLVGTVADSDIRKALIRQKDLNRPVQEIMNAAPSFVRNDSPRRDLVQLVQRRNHVWVPVLDGQKRVTGLLNSRETYVRPALHSNPVIVLAGGRGERLRPLTLDTPKPMLHVGGQPLLEIILRQLKEGGFLNVHLSVNYLADQIVNHFGDGSDLGMSISYLRENRPLGTAGCLSLLDPAPDEPFIVINGDLLTGLNFDHLLQYHLQERRPVTVCACEHRVAIPYGVFSLRDTVIESIEEKPEKVYHVNAGIYVFSPEVLRHLKRDEPRDMPDLLQDVIREHPDGVSCFPVKEYWLDIGRPQDYQRANHEFPHCQEEARTELPS